MSDATFRPARQGGTGLAGMFAGLRARIAARRIYVDTVRELSRLSNRELADLGLHRSAIEAAARDAAYGRV
ncbi:DUF1127 domain-containing protein [Palleronia sediminis]|uniref:DUF1127 domain-containing protein n=1 Tax=Palleronia sediminis TaxID=2547833 RepID=A0A4R6AHM5_9RHOB|nr:DUF1127 domain-containing protein [Palleronia sediminis]TDL81968.1 DUF1127 domain-containing protein [Palleronia sediminis]